MRALRWLALGFAGGAAIAFAVTLLRRRGLAQVTGYQAPEVNPGPTVAADQYQPAEVHPV